MNAPARFPIDDVEPRHVEIHADLEDWGRWSREKRSRLECGSAEHKHQARNGNVHMGPEYPEYVRATPANLPNERNREVDRAVLGLPQMHLAAFRLHYWHRVRAEVLCRKLALNPAHFPGFMTTGRDMVLNLLRRNAK